MNDGDPHPFRLLRCPQCAYDLTGAGDEPRCPECGFTWTPGEMFSLPALLRPWTVRLVRWVIVYLALILVFLPAFPVWAGAATVLMAVHATPWCCLYARRLRPPEHWDQLLITSRGVTLNNAGRLRFKRLDQQRMMVYWNRVPDVLLRALNDAVVHVRIHCPVLDPPIIDRICIAPTLDAYVRCPAHRVDALRRELERRVVRAVETGKS
jgi:hypothetical protein